MGSGGAGGCVFCCDEFFLPAGAGEFAILLRRSQRTGKDVVSGNFCANGKQLLDVQQPSGVRG